MFAIRFIVTVAVVVVVVISICGLIDVVKCDYCPGGCACLGSEQVICNQASLDAIPDDLPETTKYLSLGENGIQTVPSDSFKGLRQLKSVRLDSNNITLVAQFAFRGLTDVDEIALQKNPLDHLASYSFAELRNVARLYLGYNRIASIHANAFFDSHNIREVSLVGNPLTVIRSNAFTNFGGVQYFYFPTGIQRIESNSFNGLKNVSMLRLERLDIPELESRTFNGLTNVAGLEIRGSHIGTIVGGAFEGLVNVDYFNIEDNTVGELRKNAFKGIRHVGVTMVLKNTIDNVEEGGFDGLAEATKGRRVNFTDNHLPCDCRLHLFISELAKSSPDFRETNFCQLPEDIVGERASIVDVSKLNECPTASPPLNDDVYLQEKILDLDVTKDEPNTDTNNVNNGIKNVNENQNNGQSLHNPFILCVLLAIGVGLKVNICCYD